jgi:hypothetical protein
MIIKQSLSRSFLRTLEVADMEGMIIKQSSIAASSEPQNKRLERTIIKQSLGRSFLYVHKLEDMPGL